MALFHIYFSRDSLNHAGFVACHDASDSNGGNHSVRVYPKNSSGDLVALLKVDGAYFYFAGDNVPLELAPAVTHLTAREYFLETMHLPVPGTYKGQGWSFVREKKEKGWGEFLAKGLSVDDARNVWLALTSGEYSPAVNVAGVSFSSTEVADALFEASQLQLPQVVHHFQATQDLVLSCRTALEQVMMMNVELKAMLKANGIDPETGMKLAA